MAHEETLTLDAAARTDAGAVRRARGEPDEDSVLDSRFREVRDPRGVRAVFAVADGMSHLKGGKVASAQALNMLEEGVQHYARRGESAIPGIDDLESFLAYAVERIDATLKQCSENNPNIAGMGTTLTALVIEGNTARVLHAGDSRAYLLTPDAEGLQLMTADEVVEMDGKPLAANGLGFLLDSVRVNQARQPLGPGDVLLLCTDGLWRDLDDESICRVLRGSPNPATAVDRLIRAANQSQGTDNIGAVVVHVGRPDIANDAELDRLYPRPGAATPSQRRDAPSPAMPIPGARLATVPGARPAPAAEPVVDGATEPDGSVRPAAMAIDNGSSGTIPPPGTPGAGTPTPPRPGMRPRPPGVDDGLRSPVDPRTVPPRPPMRPPTSPFMAGIGGFLAGLVFLGLIWGISARVRGPKDEATDEQQPDLDMAYVQVWDKSTTPEYRDEGFGPVKLRCQTVNDEGKVEWRQLTMAGMDVNVLDKEGREAKLVLEVSTGLSPESGEPRPVLFAVKIGRTEEPEQDTASGTGAGAGTAAAAGTGTGTGPGTATRDGAPTTDSP